MSKYNLMATRADWERLYTKANELGFDIKPFKKSQNFDQAVYAFYVMAKNKLGIPLDEVTKRYQMYVYDGVIRAVVN